MGRGLYSRSIATAFGLSFALTFGFGGLNSAYADVNPNGDCWIDVATGARVGTFPQGANPREFINSAPQKQYGNSYTGRNFAQLPDGTWIDTGTGQPVSTFPVGANPREFINGAPQNQYGNSYTGHNFARVPCPPPAQTAATTGLYLGGELVKNWGRVRSTETLAATGAITNQFTDSADPIGGGIVAGYNFTPWSNWVIGPYGSFDWLRLTINHNGPGFLLGTTTNWIANFGGKLGYMVAPDWQVYGLAGAAWVNADLNVNFATAASKTATTPGFTLGLGTEYHPNTWQVAGHPVSLFAQYQHTWYADANFNTPASSPAFNYAFRRDDDTLKFGFNIYFSGPPPAAAKPILTK